MIDLSVAERGKLVARIHRRSIIRGQHLIYPPSNIVLQRDNIRYKFQARRVLFEDRHGPLPAGFNLRKICDEPDCVSCCRPIDADRQWVNRWVERYHPIDHRTKRWRPRMLARFQREFRDHLIGQIPDRLSPIDRIRTLLAIDEKVENYFRAPRGNINEGEGKSYSQGPQSPPAEADRGSDQAGS
jgi:hypothetical protein